MEFELRYKLWHLAGPRPEKMTLLIQPDLLPKTCQNTRGEKKQLPRRTCSKRARRES